MIRKWRQVNGHVLHPDVTDCRANIKRAMCVVNVRLAVA